MQKSLAETIKEFDELISSYKNQLKKHNDHLVFDKNSSITFTLSQDVDDSIFDSLKEKKGLYLFELELSSYNKGVKTKTKIKNFANDWRKNKYHSTHSSNIIEIRLNQHNNFSGDWLPLYIGKCMNIQKRIINHLNLSQDSRTYAMKLKSRKNLYGLNFRVQHLELNVSNYSFIAPHLEKLFRDKYNPIIGKQ